MSIGELGSIFVTTTIAPAIATVVCMVFTWMKYGKPDVSMCLNASLAGLVAITASCDVTDALGSIIIGAVAGVLVIFGVWLLDYKLHIDDPVGAVASTYDERYHGEQLQSAYLQRIQLLHLQEDMVTVSSLVQIRLLIKDCFTGADLSFLEHSLSECVQSLHLRQ